MIWSWKSNFQEAKSSTWDGDTQTDIRRTLVVQCSVWARDAFGSSLICEENMQFFWKLIVNRGIHWNKQRITLITLKSSLPPEVLMKSSSIYWTWHIFSKIFSVHFYSLITWSWVLSEELQSAFNISSWGFQSCFLCSWDCNNPWQNHVNYFDNHNNIVGELIIIFQWNVSNNAPNNNVSRLSHDIGELGSSLSPQLLQGQWWIRKFEDILAVNLSIVSSMLLFYANQLKRLTFFRHILSHIVLVVAHKTPLCLRNP